VKEVTAQLPNFLVQATSLTRLSKETDLKPIIDFLEKHQNNPATRGLVQPLALALNKQFAEIEKQRAQRKQKARNHLAAYCWIAITFNSWYERHKHTTPAPITPSKPTRTADPLSEGPKTYSAKERAAYEQEAYRQKYPDWDKKSVAEQTRIRREANRLEALSQLYPPEFID
jgi:hypothetical protein